MSEPVDLTIPSLQDLNGTVGQPADAQMPPPGMTMEEVSAAIFARFGAPCTLTKGDRIQLLVDALVYVQISWFAPFSSGAEGVVPAGTVFELEMDPSPTAIGFGCRPVDYAEVERIIVPEADRGEPKYGGFHVTFLKRYIGTYLQVLEQ